MGEAEQVEQSVESEAAEFGCVRDAVFARLLSRPVAGNVNFAQKAGLAGKLRLVAVEGDYVGRSVAMQEPAIERVNLPVRDKNEVDDR